MTSLPLIIAPKPPLPANIGPDLKASSPTEMPGSTCSPKIAVTFCKTPSSQIFISAKYV